MPGQRSGPCRATIPGHAGLGEAIWTPIIACINSMNFMQFPYGYLWVSLLPLIFMGVLIAVLIALIAINHAAGV